MYYRLLLELGKNESYEDKLIGQWSIEASGVTIIYSFEDEAGEYKATYIIETDENTKSITTYSYSAPTKQSPLLRAVMKAFLNIILRIKAFTLKV